MYSKLTINGDIWVSDECVMTDLITDTEQNAAFIMLKFTLAQCHEWQAADSGRMRAQHLKHKTEFASLKSTKLHYWSFVQFMSETCLIHSILQLSINPERVETCVLIHFLGYTETD